MYSDKIDALFTGQFQEWELARHNYSLLENVRTRKLDFGTFEVSVQFNPERMRSSAAKVDTRSIGERPCFLCSKNRPPEQRGLSFKNGLTFLVNPFPIFNRHLTIPSDNHTDQRIGNNFGAMLSLSQAIPSFTVFYNGPRCGASAPDHFHFQAIHRNMLPIESEYKGNQSGRLTIFDDTEIQSVKLDQRRLLAITGSDQDSLIRVFGVIYHLLEESLPAADEPMLNILTWYDSGKWIILIFPRKQHRPSQYFEAGDRQILLSPASIDLGGVLILPRNPDFEKISKDDATDILNQVCVDDFFMTVLTDRLKEVL